MLLLLLPLLLLLMLLLILLLQLLLLLMLLILLMLPLLLLLLMPLLILLPLLLLVLHFNANPFTLSTGSVSVRFNSGSLTRSCSSGFHARLFVTPMPLHHRAPLCVRAQLQRISPPNRFCAPFRVGRAEGTSAPHVQSPSMQQRRRWRADKKWSRRYEAAASDI